MDIHGLSLLAGFKEGLSGTGVDGENSLRSETF